MPKLPAAWRSSKSQISSTLSSPPLAFTGGRSAPENYNAMTQRSIIEPIRTRYEEAREANRSLHRLPPITIAC